MEQIREGIDWEGQLGFIRRTGLEFGVGNSLQKFWRTVIEVAN